MVKRITCNWLIKDFMVTSFVRITHFYVTLKGLLTTRPWQVK